MQIFVTYPDPIKCAKYLDNRRLIKMVLESAQLLSTAIHLNGDIGPYKITHKNHPLAIWTRTSQSNYQWLLQHLEALCAEYTRRFKKIHKTSTLIGIFSNKLKLIPSGKQTPFINCTTYKHIENVFISYRLELRKKWKNDIIKPRWRKV